MNPQFRNFAIWIVILLLLVGLFKMFENPGRGAGKGTSEITYSEFRTGVDSSQIKDVTVSGNKISGTKSDGTSFWTLAPDDPGIIDKLYQSGVAISAKQSDEGTPGLIEILINWFPMLLLLAVWIFFMRQMQSGGGRAMGFGKSKAKLLTERQGRITFEDVAGVDEAKEDLAGDRRVPARSPEVPAARRQDSAWRAARRSARHRQDVARPRHRG